MTELIGDIGGGIGEVIVNALQSLLYSTIYKLFYYIGWALSYMLRAFSEMFEIMASLHKVNYNGKYEYLINVFFSNTTVSKVYWGMALIGMALTFGFALVAVMRKLFDGGEKEKRSYGAILGAMFKSFLIILCMNFIITAVLNSTNILMQQVNYVFAAGDALGQEESITYTDEELAAMARVFNTIGNYSMNPSYNNRYNLNSCFNELRPDLQYLANQGVFEFYYITEDENGRAIDTWQSMLQTLASSASLTQDLKLDVYYESVSRALLDIMDTLRVDQSFRPLASYERKYTVDRNTIPLDRLVFLMSTTRAAKNDTYNINASMHDTLRAPYYHGDKDMYDIDDVNQDFDIAIYKFDYIIWYYAAYKLLRSLATIILNCVARIFNMLLLYLIAPPVVAVMPLDDGGKFKQWTTAFVVQSLSVFGTVIAMRVLLLFIPIVMDASLVLFENSFTNFLAKLVIVYGGFEVAEKATGLITGILADNAGIQSLTAGDMSSSANKVMDLGEKGLTMAGGSALKFGGKAGLGALKYTAIGGAMTVAGAALGVGYAGYGAGKLAVAGGSKLGSKIGEWRDNRKRQQAYEANLKDIASKRAAGQPVGNPTGGKGGGPGTPPPKGGGPGGKGPGPGGGPPPKGGGPGGKGPGPGGGPPPKGGNTGGSGGLGGGGSTGGGGGTGGYGSTGSGSDTFDHKGGGVTTENNTGGGGNAGGYGSPGGGGNAGGYGSPGGGGNAGGYGSPGGGGMDDRTGESLFGEKGWANYQARQTPNSVRTPSSSPKRPSTSTNRNPNPNNNMPNKL